MRQILLSDYYPDFYEDEFEGREERSIKRSVFLTIIILTGILLCPCLLYVQQNVQYAKWSYGINSLRKTNDNLQDENTYLQAEKEQLNSLERIEKVAREKFGLVSPDERIIPLQE